jgi:hypothetical protein
MSDFKDELRSLINQHSLENGSDTPDYILAEYLSNCLAAFEVATVERESWYGRSSKWGSHE